MNDDDCGKSDDSFNQMYLMNLSTTLGHQKALK